MLEGIGVRKGDWGPVRKAGAVAERKYHGFICPLASFL